MLLREQERDRIQLDLSLSQLKKIYVALFHRLHNARGGMSAAAFEEFDEDDMLLITLEFANNRFATLQYGSAFRWADHFVKIQGTKGAILIDLQDVKVVLKTPEGEERFLLHRSQEEDDDRTRIYKGLEMDGAISIMDDLPRPTR